MNQATNDCNHVASSSPNGRADSGLNFHDAPHPFAVAPPDPLEPLTGNGWGDESLLPKRLRRGRLPALALCTIVFYFMVVVPAGAFGSIKFFHHLNFADFNAARTSILHQSSNDRWDNPGETWNNPEYLLVQTIPRGTPLNVFPRNVILQGLSDLIAEKVSTDYQGYIGGLRGYYLPGWGNETLMGGINNDTTIISFNWLGGDTKGFVEAVEADLRSKIVATLLPPSEYRFEISGMAQLQDALTNTVFPNMAHIDAVAIPSGIFLFCIAARSLPAFIIPTAVVIVSLVSTLAWGDLLKKKISVTGFAPELMGSMVIALSIDFSLFFMARLRECHHDPAFRSRRSPASTVWFAYTKVSHNIAVSAFAIALAFGGLAFIKSDFVRSIALVCCIGALMVLCASVTLLPAIAYFMYPFCFDNCLNRNLAKLQRCMADRLCCRTATQKAVSKQSSRSKKVQRRDVADDDESTPTFYHPTPTDSAPRGTWPQSTSGGSGEHEPLIHGNTQQSSPQHQGGRQSPLGFIDDDSRSGDELTRPDGAIVAGDAASKHGFIVANRSIWAKAARKATNWWPLVVLLVLGATAPFVYIIATRFDYDGNFFASAPDTVPSYWNYLEAQSIFGNNIDTPLYVVLSTSNTNQQPIFSEEFWPAYDIILEEVRQTNTSAINLHIFDAPNWWRGQRISWQTAADGSTRPKHFHEQYDARTKEGSGVVHELPLLSTRPCVVHIDNRKLARFH